MKERNWKNSIIRLKLIERIFLKDWKKLKEHCLKILKKLKQLFSKRLRELERILLKDWKKLKNSFKILK